MNITVCIATFNGEKYIKKQIISILNQINSNDEIVISDDSSTDDTINIIKNINDSRIKLFQNNKFYNPIYNFENAIKKSTGDIIVLSDQDDIWLNNKIKIIKERFRNKIEDIYTLMMNGYIIDKTGKVINDSIYSYNGSGKGIIKNIIKNTYMGCSMAFTRKSLDVLLPFPKNIPMHDSWIGILSEIFGEVKFDNRKSIKYRIHDSNQSLTKTNLNKKIYWRYHLVKELIKRYINIKFN